MTTGRVRAAAARVDRATPASRERALDGLRALAIAGVVLGHWLVTALVLWGDGGLRVSSPLKHLPGLAPASWALQTLALFFLVGGYVAARGLRRARERAAGTSGGSGAADAEWLRGRLLRLGRPVVLALAAWGVLAAGLAAAGTPAATVRTGLLLALQPLWFIAVYLAVTTLTRWAVAADARFGAAAVAAPLAVAAACDAARFGPWGGHVPDAWGYAAVLPVWQAAYQAGVAWESGRLGRRGAGVLLAAGAVGLAVLPQLGYPVSVVGVPGAERSNSAPPTLMLPALGFVQIGAAVLLRGPVERLLRHPVPWAATVLVNVGALTVFCWHLTAVVLVSAAGAAVGGVLPGLTDTPDGPGWLLARACWAGAFALVLAALWAAARRFEGPWRGTVLGLRPARAVVAACAATALAIAAALL
jgi:hypothetical protein